MERTPNKPVKSHRIDATPSIPLRPELIACMDPQSLGRYSCASATLRKDVLDSKAWELMANAQKLRSARDAALAAERDAVAWVKSQVLRRRLADSLSQEAPPFVLNTPADFTYFARLEEDGVVIWEGDLGSAHFAVARHSGTNSVRMSLAELPHADSAKLRDLVAFLRQPAGDQLEADFAYMDRLRITLVAIRNEDQAMIALGSFTFKNHSPILNNRIGFYIFRSAFPLFQSVQSEGFKVWIELSLRVTSGGEPEFLEFCVEHHHFGPASPEDPDATWIYDLHRPQIQHLLSYLAGIPHRARECALEVMDGWIDGPN